jgi:hypothetical protein
VALLKRLERAGTVGGTLAWTNAVPYFEEPILAIQADTVINEILKCASPQDSERATWVDLQQSARRVVYTALVQYKSLYGGPDESPPLVDVHEAIRLAHDVLIEHLPKLAEPEGEHLISRLIVRLGHAQGYPALETAFQWLRGIDSAIRTVGHRHLTGEVEAALGRVYIKLLAEASGPDADHAYGLLKYGSGGDAGSFLFDVESIRSGRSPFAQWIQQAVRATDPESTPSNTLAEARLYELGLGAFDGIPFPPEVSVDLLRYSIEIRPPRLPNGDSLGRRNGDLEHRTLLMISALTIASRSQNDPAMQALDHASLLVGDPRVDGASLFDWVHSLLGDRRSLSDDQYARYLQEANAIFAVVQQLGQDRRVVISREHRKKMDEELHPSFDLWVIDVASDEVTEGIEIKQTDRPRQASDLAGIVRQATRKLDGKLVVPAPKEGGTIIRYRMQANAPSQSLRYIEARRVLVIQIPWDRSPVRYARASLNFISFPDGRVERWRGEPEGGGILVGSYDLFQEIARHFHRITDANYFNEIRLTRPTGEAIVSFHNKRGKARSDNTNPISGEGNWSIMRPESRTRSAEKGIGRLCGQNEAKIASRRSGI